MARLTEDFTGVPDGEVYPRTFRAGEECPAELEEAARGAGAIGDSKAVKPPSNKAAKPAENK